MKVARVKKLTAKTALAWLLSEVVPVPTELINGERPFRSDVTFVGAKLAEMVALTLTKKKSKEEVAVGTM